jgi:hypothetical protein
LPLTPEPSRRREAVVAVVGVIGGIVGVTTHKNNGMDPQTCQVAAHNTCK